MVIGVLKETYPNERRVALAPPVVPLYKKFECQILVQTGAGLEAAFPDAMYEEQGASIVSSREELFARADCLITLRTAGANEEASSEDIRLLRSGQTLIGFMEPLWRASALVPFAASGANLYAMELMPRITRAQSMDALSSMATIIGYKAVLLAANRLPQMFPMLMTAAGTITPARVFVIGAGVAGLQAMATAKRLGASVEGYDVRPAARDQVESVGAKFVELDLDTDNAEDKGGYARALGEETYKRQQALLTPYLSRSDVVITTAAIPGKRAPLLVTREMVHAMPTGSLIVDIAAEWGGNCELTQPNQIHKEGTVEVIGAVNLASTLPTDASLLYSRNLFNFIQHLFKQGALPTPSLPAEDEIARETLVATKGEMVNDRVKQSLNA